MLDVLHFLRDRTARGETALLAVTQVIGSSSRALGTVMAVSADGSCAGSLSGGCVEAAIIGEAQRVIASRRAEILRFGQGSRFMDIRLPCGGGLDVMIVPSPNQDAIRQACVLLEARNPATLQLDLAEGLAVRIGESHDQAGWVQDKFLAPALPRLRLVIAGHGAETQALAWLGATYGAEILVLSPDEAILRVLPPASLGLYLQRRGQAPNFHADHHTAVVLLFHDHEWEPELLASALAQSPFFIGAMGSRATHAQRLQRLAARGMSDAQLARVHGPIGLIPSARDPETLALSVLSQIVKLHRESLALAPSRTARASGATLPSNSLTRPSASFQRQPAASSAQ